MDSTSFLENETDDTIAEIINNKKLKPFKKTTTSKPRKRSSKNGEREKQHQKLIKEVLFSSYDRMYP